MAILPKAPKTDSTVLRAQLDRTKSYEDFSAEVRAQAIQMVHNERPAGRGGLHKVENVADAPTSVENMTVIDLLASISPTRPTQEEDPRAGSITAAEQPTTIPTP